MFLIIILRLVPRLYKKARPAADCEWSPQLLERYKAIELNVATKSGLMLGLGEAIDELSR